MATRWGQTGWKHKDSAVQKEFERVSKDIKELKENITIKPKDTEQKPAITSNKDKEIKIKAGENIRIDEYSDGTKIIHSICCKPRIKILNNDITITEGLLNQDPYVHIIEDLTVPVKKNKYYQIRYILQVKSIDPQNVHYKIFNAQEYNMGYFLRSDLFFLALTGGPSVNIRTMYPEKTVSSIDNLASSFSSIYTQEFPIIGASRTTYVDISSIFRCNSDTDIKIGLAKQDNSKMNVHILQHSYVRIEEIEII